MRKLRVTALVFGAALLSTAALAGAMTATGTVKSVDVKGDAITLDDGSKYILSEGTEAETVKVGSKVTVVYEMKNSKMVATSVKVVE